MQGVLGLCLIILGAIFLYDVIAGKSEAIIGLINGQTDVYQPANTVTGVSYTSTPYSSQVVQSVQGITQNSGGSQTVNNTNPILSLSGPTNVKTGGINFL